MKRFVFGTLGTLLTLHIVTWILNRNSLSLIDPYADGYYTSNCTWYSWPDGHLNLSQFYNRNITGKIYNYYNHSQTLFFTYTPCANTIRCPGSNGSMITISNNYTNSFCVPIAFWEYGTNDPTHHIYGPNGNEYYWEFIYNQSNYTHINESVHINWYCDPTVRGYRTNGSYYRRNEYNGNMMFDFDISSSVACNSTNFTNITTTTTTTTTQIPGGKCLWNMGGHILNLTAFRNQTLATVDSKNSSIVVAMTPCDNLLICDDGNFVEAVMAYREEFMHNTCVDYLAIWDEGLNEPRYDVSSRTWQFVYENGQKCGGFERVFQVFWKCDYQTRNTAKIVTFEQTGSCSFEMHINSSYACS